ncbi:hypothetical protein ABZ807_28415 [Micromonospora sp. NPDC047548]|uniref:hypothetical protein n=1 Tax=Micromonospora sp. NPDC047548 TaxID=3155624 RepID=UPI0033E47DA8
MICKELADRTCGAVGVACDMDVRKRRRGVKSEQPRVAQLLDQYAKPLPGWRADDHADQCPRPIIKLEESDTILSTESRQQPEKPNRLPC